MQFASLSQEKELADYDDLWHGSDCNELLKTTTKSFKTSDEFLNLKSLYLLLPRSELMKELFAVYDRNQMYCFTFRDFLFIRGSRADPALESLDLDNIFTVSFIFYAKS